MLGADLAPDPRDATTASADAVAQLLHHSRQPLGQSRQQRGPPQSLRSPLSRSRILTRVGRRPRNRANTSSASSERQRPPTSRSAPSSGSLARAATSLARRRHCKIATLRMTLRRRARRRTDDRPPTPHAVRAHAMRRRASPPSWSATHEYPGGGGTHPRHRAPHAARPCQPLHHPCLLYTSPSPRDRTRSRMPSSA